VSRIPAATRESVPQDQLAAFGEMVSQRGSVPDIGPISVMINVPELTRRGEHFRAYIRGDESSLPLNVRELAMILTAREMDCQFIWNAHCAFARQAGLSDELVNNLRDKKNLPALSAEEAAVVDYGRELFRTRKVSPPVYDAALALSGVRDLVELTNLLVLLVPGLQHHRIAAAGVTKSNEPPFRNGGIGGILAIPDIPSLVAENHRNPLAPLRNGGTIF